MARKRSIRVVGHAVRLALFVLAVVYAGRFLVGTLDSRGWSPAAFFGLLLVAGALSLVWRGTLDLRKALHRMRS